MLTSSDSLQAIQAALPTMTPAARSLAEYLLGNPDQTCFLTASELAQAAGVSHASVIRFAQSLGYSGYPELQKALQSRLTRRLTTVERLEGVAADEADGFWVKQMSGDQQNLTSTMRDLNPEECERASAWLAGARTIYVLGLRSTKFLADLSAFALRLASTGPRVVVLSPTEYLDQLATADEHDVLVGFSFPRYFRPTVEIMRHAHRLGVRCIAVTDSLASPLAQVAQISLICRVQMNSFIESFVAPLSLVNALVTHVALRNKGATLERLGALERIWESHNLYYSKERNAFYGTHER